MTQYALLLCFLCCWAARAGTLNFEAFPDSTILTSQYSGVMFTNAIILSAGISLNEFEFPPHSGTNVVSDNGGPMSIEFANPVSSFGGYFTYAEPLTVTAFDAGDDLLGSVTSLFSSNLALSGDPGSSPNEFLQLNFAGITSVSILGDPGGGSFVLDDAVVDAASSPSTTTPEPISWPVMLTAAAICVVRKRLL